MLQNHFCGSSSTAGGAGLIEVLVAAALVGLAGLTFTTLQFQSLSAARDVAWYDQANQIALSATEYFLANPEGWAVYKAAANWGRGSHGAGSDCVGRRRCDAAQMARADIKRLQRHAQTHLPDGRVSVLPCDGGGASMCVVVAWAELSPRGCQRNKRVSERGGCYRMPFYVGP
ncbi:MAG: hypothetical protein P8176_05940 [Gammaproteobacteria bacterium]